MNVEQLSPAERRQRVQEIIRSLDDPRADNRPVMAINVIAMQRAKNGGYPIELYHATEEPVLALNRSQEQELQRFGYRRQYIVQLYPKWKYRRNPDERFAESDGVEAIVVRDKQHEEQILKMKAPKDASEWVDDYTSLPPVAEEGDGEDPALVISRLEGQLEEARRKSGK